MKTHIIIGTAAAGIGTLNTLIKLDPTSRIICISDESENPYNKCFLADYAHNIKQEGELFILRKEVAENPNVEILLSTRVVKIDAHPKSILLHDGRELIYDTLFIGTGSSPMIPPIKGVGEGAGIFTFHTLADTNKILAYAKDHGVERVAVVGAGLSGLECADSLRARGMEVTVIERGERVLARQVDEMGAQFIADLMKNAGVELWCNQQVEEIIMDHGKVSGIRVKQNIPAQMVIIATGLKPNIELAQSAGLAIEQGYIKVNEHMQTSDPAIFAGGDCVQVFDQISKQFKPSCTWPDAMQQGSVAAHGMAGIKKSYSGALLITSSAFFGKTFVTCGPVANPPADYEVRVSSGEDYYHKILLLDGVVKGYLLIGNTAQAPKLRRSLLTSQSFDELRTGNTST